MPVLGFACSSRCRRFKSPPSSNLLCVSPPSIPPDPSSLKPYAQHNICQLRLPKPFMSPGLLNPILRYLFVVRLYAGQGRLIGVHRFFGFCETVKAVYRIELQKVYLSWLRDLITDDDGPTHRPLFRARTAPDLRSLSSSASRGSPDPCLSMQA